MWIHYKQWQTATTTTKKKEKKYKKERKNPKTMPWFEEGHLWGQ